MISRRRSSPSVIASAGSVLLKVDNLTESRMSPNGIYTLPAELLVLIFHYGSQATLHQLGVPFCIIISHVSQHWRGLVYGTSSLWRAIPPTSPTLLHMFLARSQGYTIDVYLHARTRVGDAALLKIVDFLLDHSHRWRSLYIRADTAPLLFLVISRLRKTKAPSLERFELYVDAQPHTVGQLPMIFVDESLSRLSSVTLEGVGFTGMIKVPVLSGLTSLTLARLPRGMGKMTYRSFRDLLDSSPQLKHLSLDGVAPRLVHWGEYELIALPHLESLDMTISDEYPDIHKLFTILHVPALNVFRYGGSWHCAWKDFQQSFSYLSRMCPDLQEIHFSVVARSDEYLAEQDLDVHSLLSSLANVRMLTLNVSEDALATYFLLPWIQSLDALRTLKLLTVRAPYNKNSLVDLHECLDRLLSLCEMLGKPFKLLKETITVTVIPADSPSYESSISQT